MIKIYLSALLFFILPDTAYSYFDPGTGSYIIQIILAFLASCYFFITNPIQSIKNYFKRKRNVKDEDQNESKDQK
tara:strand:+ start:142 stop:366 length:225 start_codon:yes stop_codon:yes gene_type:complete